MLCDLIDKKIHFWSTHYFRCPDLWPPFLRSSHTRFQLVISPFMYHNYFYPQILSLTPGCFIPASSDNIWSKMVSPWLFKHSAFLVYGMKLLYTQNSSSYIEFLWVLRIKWNKALIECKALMECQALRKPSVNLIHYQFMAWRGEGERKKKSQVASRLWLRLLKNRNSPNL